jgi:hypothetical protein
LYIFLKKIPKIGKTWTDRVDVRER